MCLRALCLCISMFLSATSFATGTSKRLIYWGQTDAITQDTCITYQRQMAALSAQNNGPFDGFVVVMSPAEFPFAGDDYAPFRQMDIDAARLTFANCFSPPGPVTTDNFLFVGASPGISSTEWVSWDWFNDSQ